MMAIIVRPRLRLTSTAATPAAAPAAPAAAAAAAAAATVASLSTSRWIIWEARPCKTMLVNRTSLEQLYQIFVTKDKARSECTAQWHAMPKKVLRTCFADQFLATACPGQEKNNVRHCVLTTTKHIVPMGNDGLLHTHIHVDVYTYNW